jgi:hypothetical protein
MSMQQFSPSQCALQHILTASLSWAARIRLMVSGVSCWASAMSAANAPASLTSHFAACACSAVTSITGL